MNSNLEVLAPEKWAGQTLPLMVFPYLIGRDTQCTLRATSQIVSRRHCCLFETTDHLVVRDLGSTNGTFVNDQPVEQERELHEGDRLAVGPFLFAIHLPQHSEEFTLAGAAHRADGPHEAYAGMRSETSKKDDLASWQPPPWQPGQWVG